MWPPKQVCEKQSALLFCPVLAAETKGAAWLGLIRLWWKVRKNHSPHYASTTQAGRGAKIREKRALARQCSVFFAALFEDALRVAHVDVRANFRVEAGGDSRGGLLSGERGVAQVQPVVGLVQPVNRFQRDFQHIFLPGALELGAALIGFFGAVGVARRLIIGVIRASTSIAKVRMAPNVFSDISFLYRIGELGLAHSPVRGWLTALILWRTTIPPTGRIPSRA